MKLVYTVVISIIAAIAAADDGAFVEFLKSLDINYPFETPSFDA